MKKTKEESLQTKESMMDSALDVFLSKGYSQTTTQDIVNRIDATRGAFYFHFKDKDDLFNQVMARELAFISGLIVDSFTDHSNEKTKISQLLSNIIDNFYNNRRFRKVIQVTWFRVEVDVNCRIMRDKTSFNEFFLEELAELLKQAQRSRKLKVSISPVETATHITALILGIYRMYFVTPSYARKVDVSKNIVLTYIDQIFN